MTELQPTQLHSTHDRTGSRYYVTRGGWPRECVEIPHDEWLRLMSIEADSGINRRGAPVVASETWPRKAR